MYINKKTRDKINEINTFTDAFRNSIGFEKWLDDKKKYIGIKEKNKCICSKCQKEFISNKKINDYDTCPNCNQKLLIKRSRRFDDKEYCMYLINYKDDNYILSIAFKNGFNSLEYFSEVFKKNMGVSPNIYKKYSNYKNITDKEQEKILDNLSRIINIKTNVLNYLNHRKPIISNYVKKFELK